MVNFRRWLVALLIVNVFSGFESGMKWHNVLAILINAGLALYLVKKEK